MTIWEFLLGALAFLGATFVYMATKVTAHLVGEEIEGRIDQIGYALLQLACRRLPTGLRDDYYQEWAAELDTHILEAPERPITRLYWSLRFSGSLLFTARTFARIQHPEAFTSTTGFVRHAYGLLARVGMLIMSALIGPLGIYPVAKSGEPGWLLGVLLFLYVLACYMATMLVLFAWTERALKSAPPYRRRTKVALTILSRTYPYSRIVRNRARTLSR